jgi:hypothetical protein
MIHLFAMTKLQTQGVKMALEIMGRRDREIFRGLRPNGSYDSQNEESLNTETNDDGLLEPPNVPSRRKYNASSSFSTLL